MQALNSLATPEEKLAALCKKYADLVSYMSLFMIMLLILCPSIVSYSHY